MKNSILWFIWISILTVGFYSTADAQSASQQDATDLTYLQKKEIIWNSNPVIQINLQQVSMEEALVAIAKQARAGLYYDADLLPDDTVSLESKDKPLSYVLNELLKETNLEAYASGRNILLREKKAIEFITDILSDDESEMQETVRGQVVDAQTGEALPGVNILIQGTSTGTATNIDGEFELQVPSLESVLVVSYIGYQTQEVSVDGRIELEIELVSEALIGEELVVVGYGAQRRESITGSVASVSVDDLRSSTVTGIDQALTGRVPGVQVNNVTGVPGGGPIIQIRGVGSIGAGNDPLYVIDGFPIPDSPNQRSNPLNSIAPDQIESIQILKDASATSIYGSRGANGVILITTKMGTPTTQVEINSSVGIQNVRKRGREEVLNARQFAQFMNDRISDNIRFREEREPTQEDIPEMYRNPDQYGEGTNWVDAILNDNALMHNQNITIRGGNEFVRTAMTFGLREQQGTLINTGYNRYNFRINVNANPIERLSVGVNLAPSLENQDLAATDGEMGRSGGYASAFLINPIEPIYNDDGSFNPIITGPGLLGFVNPVQQLIEVERTQRRARVNVNSYAEYELISGLSLRSTFGVDWNNQRYEHYKPTTVGSSFNNFPPQPATSSFNTSETLNWINENTINYRTNLGASHSIDLVGGLSLQKQTITIGNFNATDFPDDEIRRFNAAPSIGGNTNAAEWTLMSTFARMNYEFRNRFLITATMRMDGSSRFGSENRWGSFPSASIGWRVSEESFMSDIQQINNLLLRVGYGKSGNFNIGNFTHLGLVGTTPYALNNQEVSGRSITNLGNVNLGWEESDQINIGVDLGLFEDRLNFTLDLYNRVTDNMLLDREIPFTSGFNNAQVNSGEVTNKGIEFSINSMIVNSPTFQWNAGFNISHNSNEVTRLESPIISPAGTAQFITEEGYPIGQFYGFQVIGIFDDWEEIENAPEHPGAIPGSFRHLDVNGDGRIDPVTDFTRIGDPYPDFTWGLNNSIVFRNLDFSFQVTGSHGGETLQTAFEELHNLDGVFNVNTESLARWRSPDDPGDGIIPRAISPVIHRFNQSTWVRDNSNIWIRNIALGYTFDSSQFAILNAINSLRIYINIDNAWISNTNFQNPEEALNATNPLQPGQTRNLNHPISRVFTAGFNLNF
jgi:TonB-dependent starch-binding outer membrane protein SusC